MVLASDTENALFLLTHTHTHTHTHTTTTKKPNKPPPKKKKKKKQQQRTCSFFSLLNIYLRYIIKVIHRCQPNGSQVFL